ncbi:MAG: bifunctional glutamate--cysteine ligase GshA/glutathione synthetase GshB [Marinifilaceae bacterium]
MINSLLKAHNELLQEGVFGLEKENVRVTPDGQLALTPHPAIFGDKTQNPYITTDFSESQVEMITPPMASIPQALDFIETLHDIVSDNIGDELLWPQSLPPLLPDEDKIPIAQYNDEDKELEEYREAIARIYGKQRQLISGIHFNVSLSDKFFSMLFHAYKEKRTMGELREEVYLKMVRGFMRHRWLMVWLFGETPVAERNFRVTSLETGLPQKMKCGEGISLRTGPLGYRNKEEFVLDYTSIESYRKQINEFVEEGRLHSIKELYLPLRIKFLPKDGGAPSYLEIRLQDLDPLTRSGVSPHALYFTHLMLMYALVCDETHPFDAREQYIATRKQDYVSCFGRCEKRSFPEDISTGVTVVEEAEKLLSDMELKLAEYGVWNNPVLKSELDYFRYLLANPDERSGMIIFRATQNNNFMAFHMERARLYREVSQQQAFRFHGYEDMEMSTQLLLRAAVCRGVFFDILDRKENFLKLYTDRNIQYVQQATKTSLDGYATICVMENKVVTKKVLEHENINVPRGREYVDINLAMDDFKHFEGEAIVIKPKSTNFGIGITIIKDNTIESAYREALEIAFANDDTVLIEEFVSGREYRFFVLNNEVVGVLHRVPANVVGDGYKSIRTLVEEKNKDPRRGKGYVTPLEKLRLGKEEEMFLAMQELTFDSVPEKGVTVYLRENSNISTGGDSIDFTDEVSHTYKAIAVNAARAVGAKITGVDMMIPDIYEPAGVGNYAIIEMNFNPAIHIHCFPFRGKNRKINIKLVEALGF